MSKVFPVLCHLMRFGHSDCRIDQCLFVAVGPNKKFTARCLPVHCHPRGWMLGAYAVFESPACLCVSEWLISFPERRRVAQSFCFLRPDEVDTAGSQLCWSVSPDAWHAKGCACTAVEEFSCLLLCFLCVCFCVGPLIRRQKDCLHCVLTFWSHHAQEARVYSQGGKDDIQSYSTRC